jgi:outer membrane protein assembly factor BamB
MMLRRAVPILLAIACAAHGAELGWSGAPGAQAPTGWSVQAGSGAKVLFLERAIEITAANDIQALAIAAVDLPDGQDDRPLRVSALVSASGDRAVTNYPAMLALEWAGGAVFAVGLGTEPRSRRDDRRVWALWNGAGVEGTECADLECFAGSSPAHVRLVLTAHEIAAYGSRDGWSWTRIAGLPRERLGALGPPARVVCGRGQLRSGATGLAADPPPDARGKLKPATYRFAELTVEDRPAEVPAALMRTYSKHDSLGDTVDAIAATGRPQHWRIKGPDLLRDTQLAQVLADDFLTGEGWTEHDMPEGGRILQLGRLLPGAGNHIRWATTALTTSEAGWVRLRFDGARRCWLWVDNRLVAVSPAEINEAEPDRLSASVWLPAGAHSVVLGVTAQKGSDNRAVTTLRWEQGDPRWRIALLRRLAIDFPGDEALEESAFEISRLWEGLGYAREAASCLDGVIAGGVFEQVERARAERARLFNQLGDVAAATAETTALQQLWSENAADPISAARRTARLWQRLDVPERALAVLTEAMAQPGLAADVRSALAVEQARMYRQQGDEAGVAAKLRLAAAQLPAEDSARFDLLSAALRVDPAADRPAFEALAALVDDPLRARTLAGICAARKDEPGRLAARRQAAAMRPNGLDLPAIALAEDLVVAKDEPGAVKLYQTELARRRQTPAATLPELRVQLLRAVLSEQPLGAKLLAEASRLPPQATQPLTWQVCGPVTLGDWQAHENPAFAVAKGAAAGAVGGKAWQAVPADAWQGGVLDLGRFGATDNAVMYLATTFASDADRRVIGGFGADDGLSVWVNGERVYSDRAQRGLQPDSIAITLPLRKGSNTIVCSVQNGGGPTAFQARLRREPWPASDLAGVLADAGGAGRVAAGGSLAALIETLAAADRREEAVPLVRALIACWPDNLDLQLRPARSLLLDRAWAAGPTVTMEIIGWFDALVADRRWDDADMQRTLGEVAGERMLENGLVEECLARQRRTALVELDPVAHALAHLREANLWLGMGFPHLATTAISDARDAAPGNEDIERKLEALQRQVRLRKGAQVAVAAPFEIATLLRTAERAATGGDAERAANDWQQAIETGRDLPVPLGGGRIVGAAQHAANRLAASGDAVLKAWLERQAGRAATALERVGGRAGATDLDRIAQRWPFAPAAAIALRREADAWAAAGAWPLALGSAWRVLDLLSGEARGPALVRVAQAAAHLGDVATLDAQLVELKRLGKTQAWDARQLSFDRLSGALHDLLPPAPEQTDPQAVDLAIRLSPYALAMRSDTVADAVAPVPQAVRVGDLVVVSTPDDVAAFAADGSLRWRLADDRLPGGTTPAIPAAGEAAAVAVDGGTIVAGLRRGDSRRLVAIDLGDGNQRWSSTDQPALADAALASAPTICGGRVWALFVTSGRGIVACLDAADGTPLWTATLGSGLARQPLVGQVELVVAGDAPAPALRGRELFVSSDAGQVAAFDAIDGRLLWLHAYHRAAFEPRDAAIALGRLMARARGSVQVDNDRVYVAPRDALGVLAIDRRLGTKAWHAELVDVRELAELTPFGLLGVGVQLCCLDPATGALQWRSSRRAGVPLGVPAVVGETALFSTATGLIRVALARGAASFGATWQSMGLEATVPSRLVVSGGRLLACGDGIVASLAASAGKARGSLIRTVQPLRTHAKPAGTDAPAAIAVRWELPVGRIEELQRPLAADADEVYVLADGSLTRVTGGDGTASWSFPVGASDMRLTQVAGDSLLLWTDSAYSVHDRLTGRLRWKGTYDGAPLLQSSRESWRNQASLAGSCLVRWRWRESSFSTFAIADGHPLLQQRINGSIIGASVRGEDIHLAIARGKSLVFAVHRLADGAQLSETPAGIEVDDWPSHRTMRDGDLLISSRLGAVWWRAGEGRALKVDLGLNWIHTMWKDGERYVVTGVREGNRNATATLEADGQVVGKQELSPAWGEIKKMLNRADRWVGDVRLRLSLSRKEDDGILGLKADGSELFRLESGERGRRVYQWVVPFGRGALALLAERGGRRRVQYIDIPSGKLVCESDLPATVLSGVMPQVAGGSLLVATDRGVVAVVPVATAPALTPGLQEEDDQLTVWRAGTTPAADGHLDEWDGLAHWDVPQIAGMTLGATWTDDGMAIAVRVPRLPAAIGRTVLAIDPIRDGAPADTAPLLLDLEWQGGLPVVRVLDMPVRDEGERTPVQARARSDGTGLVWETVIPWVWLFSKGVRSSNALNLAAAVFPTHAGDPVLEIGGGLVGGVDRARFERIRLVDRKPDPAKDGKKK